MDLKKEKQNDAMDQDNAVKLSRTNFSKSEAEGGAAVNADKNAIKKITRRSNDHYDEKAALIDRGSTQRETREGYVHNPFIKINKDAYGLAFASLIDVE